MLRGLEALDILGAALERRPVGLVGDVAAVEDLVGKLQVALVADLLDVTPEDGLILFGGQFPLLLPETLPLGRAVASP
jgi:hypothetical protein